MAKGVSRDYRREARWRRIIREHERSGLSIREFCRRAKLTETAFYYWRRELRRREGLARRLQAEPPRRPGRPGSVAPAFVSVRVEEPGLASAGGQSEVELPGGRTEVEPPGGRSEVEALGGRIEVELPGGRRVRVIPPVDHQALADVLAVLRWDAHAALRAEPEGGPSWAQGPEGQPSSPQAPEGRPSSPQVPEGRCPSPQAREGRRC